MSVLAYAVGLLVAASAPAGRTEATRSCGAITGYRVVVVSGNTSCARARQLLRSYISTAKPPGGWGCFRGHASQGQAWAAACANAQGALIRAYPS
jgi:hypothetical protein